MKLLGLEVPDWTGPTLCETSGGDLDILPFGAWKKEVKIELKIEENKDAVPKKRKRKADSGVKVEKEDSEATSTNKHTDDVFSDSRPIKTQNSHSLNCSSHNSHSSSDVNSTITKPPADDENTDGCSL